ncbi:uncharacterized protein LOC127737440 [Mytilus californianus]|uniref:uncharacterized protein LOC127737440 n=1 Tax=Mytilus californianus TaxID=6549 RepID=UPI002246DB63|nr:uncharacterized protein LOC127737440 [Mytilus californianus]
MLVTQGLLLLVLSVSEIYCQFRPGLTNPFGTWGAGQSNQNLQGQRVANIINAQPLGLNEQQGQQLFNQVAQQVLQTMGSTSQLQNFNSPDGFNQRFGSFSPDQLLPTNPIGSADGTVPGIPNTALPNNLLQTNNFNNAQTSLGLQQGRFPFTGVNGRSQSVQGFGPGGPQTPFSPDTIPGGPESPFRSRFGVGQSRLSPGHGVLPFDGNLSPPRPDVGRGDLPFLATGSSFQPGPMRDNFPGVIPVDLLNVPNSGFDPIERELKINTRLNARLQDMHIKYDKLPMAGVGRNPLQDIKRENRRLRKLIREKKRNSNSKYQVKKKQRKEKKKGLVKGLLLGALGAFMLG